MKILITGIAGFIGFHLARQLRQRGNEVIGFDNFNAYYDISLKKRRAALLGEEGIRVMEMDLCDGKGLEKLFAEVSPSHVVHLAAQAGVRYSLRDPESYVRSNLDGFVHLLEALRRRPEIRLTYASSSSVYGANTKVPFAETDPTDRPTNLYGATKKANEVLAHAYHHMFGLYATGLRFFTVYGPWGRPDMAYFSFTRAILEGKPVPVYGNGTMRRDFTYIDDIVCGIIAAIDLGAPCEIFNLGGSHPYTVLELISAIEGATGKQAEKEFLSRQVGEVEVTYADIEKSRSILKCSPQVSLQEGIRRFVLWYQDVFRGS
jgi:UDP-glucuronate 4-epimerase